MNWKSVEEFAPALRNGYFTKKCLIEAMQAFYRKDAGRIPLYIVMGIRLEWLFGINYIVHRL